MKLGNGPFLSSLANVMNPAVPLFLLNTPLPHPPTLHLDWPRPDLYTHHFRLGYFNNILLAKIPLGPLLPSSSFTL